MLRGREGTKIERYFKSNKFLKRIKRYQEIFGEDNLMGRFVLR